MVGAAIELPDQLQQGWVEPRWLIQVLPARTKVDLIIVTGNRTGMFI